MSYMSLAPLYSYASCTTIVVSGSSVSVELLWVWSVVEMVTILENRCAEVVLNPNKVFIGQLHPGVTREALEVVAQEVRLDCLSIYVVPGSRFQVWRLRIQS